MYESIYNHSNFKQHTMAYLIRGKTIFWIFTFFAISYLLAAVLIPPQESVLLRYGINETQATFLELTVTLPVVAIWYVAYYGWSKVKNYALSLQGTLEEKGFSKLSNGLLALVLWLPINTTLSSTIESMLQNYASLTAPLVIINNYITVTVLLIAGIYLSRGAYELRSHINNHQWKMTVPAWIVLIVAGFTYAYITLSNPYRQFPGDSGTATYYLPDWLLASTLIFPYLVVFYLGFRTVQYLHTYKNNVTGLIYKDALKNLANGIAVSMLAILGIRFLVSTNTVLEDGALRLVLLVIYSLLILIALGFVLIARGAKRLQKIEEV